MNRQMEKELDSGKQYIDESTKWLYAEEKGVKVFALYGIGDGKEATTLYAVGGKRAAAYNTTMAKYLEGKNNADEGTVDFDRWIESRRGSGVGQSGGVLHGWRRRSDGYADGGIHRGQYGRAEGSAHERSQENQRKVKEQFSLRKPVEQVRDFVAVHGLTEQNLRGALALGGLPVTE